MKSRSVVWFSPYWRGSQSTSRFRSRPSRSRTSSGAKRQPYRVPSNFSASVFVGEGDGSRLELSDGEGLVAGVDWLAQLVKTSATVSARISSLHFMQHLRPHPDPSPGRRPGPFGP